MMREIIEVPLPRAASRRLISFFTFQISMFFSASFAWASLMLAGRDAGCLEEYLRVRSELDSAKQCQNCQCQCVDLFSFLVVVERKRRSDVGGNCGFLTADPLVNI